MGYFVTSHRHLPNILIIELVAAAVMSFAAMIQGWRRFFTSTALPGNGGPLRQPRGQTSIFYRSASCHLQCDETLFRAYASL